ncbi:MAG TPA: TldD/PmbA family protein [Candidatus Limnocylindrales bacterium]|nr:TldD/PmbA family protein [Candidatus Limnocylindrales bacterium]
MTTTESGRSAVAAQPPESIADRVLEIVRGRSADAEAEVTVRTGTSALTRFATSFIHQNVAEAVTSVRLRIAVDGRVAAASSDAPIGGEALARLVGDVFEAATVLPPDPDWPGLTPPTPAPDVDHWDPETAVAPASERARRVRDFVDAADGLETAGFCSTDGATVAFANTAGQRLRGRATAALEHGIARTGTSDGSARASAVALSAIDGGAVGRLAAEKARTSADPTDLEPGRYEVVLEPDAVADILHFLFVYGFNARAVEEGRSFVRLTEPQFDRSITLRDDVTDPGQLGVAFDAEGTPKRPIEVVGRGVTSAILHTRRTAKKAGVESTGHAIAGAESWGALPENIVLDPGERTLPELVAGVDRGLLVTDFWYTRILDPRTTVVTGLTRNGVWLVEGGRIVRPVKNLRFTQSYVDALGPANVMGIGRDRLLVPGAWGNGAALVPALHLGSWNFTGGARG